MSDQCKHCRYRGDLRKCGGVECFTHESWYVRELEREITAAYRRGIEADEETCRMFLRDNP